MDILLSTVIAIIWGIFPFLLKFATKTVPIDIALLLLAFIWFACTLVYSLTTSGYKQVSNVISKIDKRVLLVIAVAAVTGLFIKNILYSYVIKTSNQLNVAIAIMSLSSLVSLAYGVIFLKYRLPIQAVIGICITAIGVFTMLYFTN
jgi:drug/metabolite transporter (DMT)-like permease